jgi:hypothetical protein
MNKRGFFGYYFLTLYDAIQKRYVEEHDIASNKSDLRQNEKC